jgi:hypothetical protein
MNLAAHSRKAGYLCLLVMALTASQIALATSWSEQVLYNFQGGTSDGSGPAGSVVFDKAGNLYGALTFAGGGDCAPLGYECGLVYQLTPSQNGGAWTETILYQFQGKHSNDGSVPEGGLVIDSAGNLYGTTGYGGDGDCVLLGVKAGCGIVYELSPPTKKGAAWTKTILYSFHSGDDGYFPWGDLTFDAKGNLYGATEFGGGKGTSCNPYYQYCGTVFELSPPMKRGGNWTEKVLHSFAGMPNGKQLGDGANPNGGLVLDSKGAIYGTSYTGGYQCPHDSGQGCGTVFKLSRKSGGWIETILHRFEGTDGGHPRAGVTIGKDGRLYGTTQGGGAGNSPWGTVFVLVPRADGPWTETVLYTFQDGSDGSEPVAGLAFGLKGALYGTASGGGVWFGGTVFRLTEDSKKSWAFEVLYSFGGSQGEGAGPTAGVIFDPKHNIFSTTLADGSSKNCSHSGCGTVFEISP